MNFLEKIKNGEQKKIIENSVIFLLLFNLFQSLLR